MWTGNICSLMNNDSAFCKLMINEYVFSLNNDYNLLIIAYVYLSTILNDWNN